MYFLQRCSTGWSRHQPNGIPTSTWQADKDLHRHTRARVRAHTREDRVTSTLIPRPPCEHTPSDGLTGSFPEMLCRFKDLEENDPSRARDQQEGTKHHTDPVS